MPIYDMRHIPTGEVEEHVVSISKMEEMIQSGEYEMVHRTGHNLISQHGSTLGKTSSDWKDLLKRMKKGSGRGNTINH